VTVAIAIPVWRPSEGLVELVRALRLRGAGPVILVDDGAGAIAMDGVDVLRHAVKRGKGAAWQTAINHALCTIPDLGGMVLADSGDVSADDVMSVAGALGDGVVSAARGVWGVPARGLARVLQSVRSEAEVEKIAASVERPKSLDKSVETANTSVRATSAIFAVAFAALLGCEIYGFRTTPLFSQEIWYPIGLKRFLRYGAEFLAIAVPLLAMFPWTFAGTIAALLVVLTAVSVGPLALLSTAFFLVSSWALGSRLLRQSESASATVDVCVTMLGSGVYVFLMTLLARVTVNYALVWAILLAIPIALDVRGVLDRVTGWAKRIGSVELRSPGERISFALLAFVLGAQWFVAMLPEVSADGLAMHLAIPMNIAAYHRMTFEPSRYLWSVMPMGADWLYSIVYLLGGEYAARILNFAMLLAIVALLYRATRRWVSPAAAYLLAASLAATPIVQFVTGSLFVENYLVALVLAMVTAIWLFGETGEQRFLFCAAVAGGTAMATKYGALVFLALALPFAEVEVARRRQSVRRPALVCAIALLLLLATALPTYVIAYEKTGNPIFPFLNTRIHSPLLNPTVLIADARFHVPLDWRALYNLTFHTTKSYEGQDGSFGFQYMIVVPLAVLGLLVVRRRVAVAAVVLGLIAGALILQSTPNVRYLYTSMPLLLIAFAALLGWMSRQQRWMYHVLVVYLFVTTALNTYFLPASSYYHKDFCLRLPFSRAEKDRYRIEAAPVRGVVAYFDRNHPNSALLSTSSTSIAGLVGDIYVNNWHQQSVVEKLRSVPAPFQMLQLLRSWGVQYLLVEALAPGDQTVPPPLQRIIDNCSVSEFALGGFTLKNLKSDCTREAAEALPPAVDPAKQKAVPPGVYDELDPAVVFHGDWSHDRSFEAPYGHTVSYSDTPGVEVSIAFEGKELIYGFTKAPNRGIASVTIDGGAPRSIDMYSANPQWQSKENFCCYAAGRHWAVVRVTGEKSEKSAGRFVDVDWFEVK